jgi:hypothetical protein
MTAVAFNRIGATRLFSSNASSNAGVAGYWTGYLASATLTLQSTLDLATTWNDIGGTYLFLSATPADPAAFAAALTTWLPVITTAGPPRLLWLINPADPPGYWRAVTWYAVATGPPSAPNWTTFGIWAFSLGTYGLRIAAGTALTLDQSFPAKLTIAAGSATIAAPGAQFRPTAATTLPFQDSSIGAWTGSFAVGGSDLAHLGVELRYAIRTSRKPADARISPVSMKIMGDLSTASTLAIAWDPLHPQTRGRSELRFVAPFPVIAAGFVSQRGYKTTLQPAAVAGPLSTGGFMFCRCASHLSSNAEMASEFDLFSLAPDGAFALKVVPPSGGAGPGLTDQLMLGMSGLETIQLAPSSSTLVVFDAGQPAFAPSVALDGTLPGSDETLLTSVATTAWISVMPSAADNPGLYYYAQPRQSPLFSGIEDGAMPYQQVPAARLPALPDSSQPRPVSYPVGAYAAVAASQATAARALETAALVPKRRLQITQPAQHVAMAPATDILAITPQGLVIEIDDTQSAISEVIIASLPDTDTPSLAFANPNAAFTAALFANQRFFVVANPTLLATAATCVPPFALNLDGWRFQFDPSLWRTGDDDPTMMVWKYANRSLVELAADGAAWGWPQAAIPAGGSLKATWQRLDAYIADARDIAAKDPTSPIGAFYRDVLIDPGWNGVLFLNAPIGLGTLPPALTFLAAGIDASRFFAHHIGVGLTPFDSSSNPIKLKQSSVFGLINYVDTVDLVIAQTTTFAFKTMQLKAQFSNAHLNGFSCQIELALNRLFGAPLLMIDAQHGNNLIVSGSLQNSSGSPAYAFGLTGQNRFNAGNTALSAVEITSLRIETQANPAPGHVTCSFVLGGKLQFLDVEGFDLFSYGGAPTPADELAPPPSFLVFGQLALTLDFATTAPTVQSWSANETGIAFDIVNSVARDDSLVNCFPVTVRSLVTSPDLTPLSDTATGLAPEDMGYLSVSAPFDQMPMTPTWYGLVMSLDLGSLGALASGVGLKVELLAAWSVVDDRSAPAIYLGLKLPGTSPRDGSFPLQGVLKLGFKSFIFSTYQQNGKRAYLLRLSRFGLSVLGFHFPPGNLDLSLFGGPDGRSTGQLGWLAAYQADKPRSVDGKSAAALTAPGRDSAVDDARTGPEPRLSRAKRLGRIPRRS